MARYRKKPVVIDAVQFHDCDLEGVLNIQGFLGKDYAGADNDWRTIYINTLEGRMACPLGHWIIRGVKGEHYACAPNIFAATYEPVGGVP